MGCGGSKKSAATVGVVPDGDVAVMTSPNEAKAKELAARQKELEKQLKAEIKADKKLVNAIKKEHRGEDGEDEKDEEGKKKKHHHHHHHHHHKKHKNKEGESDEDGKKKKHKHKHHKKKTVQEPSEKQQVV